MKIKSVVAVMILALLSVLTGAEINLVPNPELQSKGGFLPDQWHGLKGKESIKAYKTENGVLRITGKYPNYVSYAGFSIQMESGKSYYLSFEMKADLLSNHAAVYYSVINENRKKLVADRVLLRRYTGPQKNWVRVGFIIPTASVSGGKKLSLSLGVYNPGRKLLAEDKALYARNFHLTYYKGQKSIFPPRPKTNAANAVMPDQPFYTHNFIGKTMGEAYMLEKNGVGFFRLNTGVMPRKNVTMKVTHPKGVQAEVYLWNRKQQTCVKVPMKNGRYIIGQEYDWLIWSNGLIFTADDTVPEQFNIGLSFECDKKKISFTIPVKQIPAFTGGKLPATRRFNSWQSFPVTRIDTKNPANTLGKKLEEYWKVSGWKHTPFVEIVNTIPYEVKPNSIACRQGVDPSGTPVPLYCNASIIAAGPEYFKSFMEKKKLADRIRKTEYVKWDYEPYTKGPVTISCFCKKCIGLFAKEKGLPVTITGYDILQKHKRAWVDFRCRQRAEAVKTVVRGIKLINPAAKFELCTMPFAPQKDEEYEEVYGIRSSLYNDFVDLFTSMNYSGNLNFYRSLEREALELTKEKRTLLNNGWGTPINGIRLGNHLLAAYFCGENYPYIAQGLYISNGEQVRELRKVMDYIARTESYWTKGKFVRNTRKVIEGFNAAENLYVLERKGSGKSWSLLFNNSEREILFARLAYDPAKESVTDLENGNVLSGKNGLLTVKLAPLSYKILEFSPEMKAVTPNLPDYAGEELELIKKHQQKTSSGKKYGMSYSITPETCTLATPVQKLVFDLKNSGESRWLVNGKNVARTIGRDVFMDRGTFFLGKRNVNVEHVSIAQNVIKFRFSFVITEAPYDGLVVRKEYTLQKNKPEMNVYIEVEPRSGYRNFRLRTVNDFIMPEKINPNAPVSEISAGNITDRNLFHIGFVRNGAKFPDNKPYFAGRYMKKQYPLTTETFSVAPIDAGYRFDASAKNLDQVFCWRTKNTGTLELIWADAYPHYDPHQIATWKTTYKLQMIKTK